MTDHEARAREVADAFARIVNPPPGNDRTTMWRWGEFRIENHASTVTLSMDAAKLLTTALRTAYAAGVEDAAKVARDYASHMEAVAQDRKARGRPSTVAESKQDAGSFLTNAIRALIPANAKEAGGG